MRPRRSTSRPIRPRHVRFETLEHRHLLASLWQNPLAPLDTNDDNFISPIDALIVINRINGGGSGPLVGAPAPGASLTDTSGDKFLSPIDALLVINFLNRGSQSNGRATAPYILRESAAVTELYVPIELGETSGVRRLRLGIDANFDMSATGSALEDSFAVYIVDRYTRETLVDRRSKGTSLFTMSGGTSDYLPGQARFDGQTLELDISTGTGTQNSALLLLQLINADSDLGSTFTVTPLGNEVISNAVSQTGVAALDSVQIPGAAIPLATLQSSSSIIPHFENVRYDALHEIFKAEVYLENTGEAVGRDVVLVLSGIDSSAVTSAISGSDPFGKAYINFREAIASGGLDRRARSERIEVEIDALVNPLRFPFQILVGADNRPPVFAPVDPIEILPGEKVRFPLSAKDPDGDRFRFTIRPDQATPTIFLDRNGILEIAPTPQQVGSYQFEVAATDGLLSSLQLVTVNVLADSVGTTQVGGKVLDVDQTPLAGVRVEIGARQTLTGVDGSFVLDLGTGPVAADTIKIRGELLSSAAYPFIAEKLPLVLEHDIFIGQKNIIHRPIYLPKLDVANGVTINPTQDTLVTTAKIPGAAVMVKAGTLMSQSGTPFTGKLTITEVPPDLTPAALPNNLIPDLIVTIQPGEMVFASPAPLALPNRAGWPAGTQMDLWSINPVTGEFDKVGAGQVSSDGSVIETTEGGIRNSSWHAWILQLKRVDPSFSEPECLSCNPKKAAASTVNLFNGAIAENHTVFAYSSQGQTRSVNLAYNSNRADVRPAVDFTATLQCVFVSATGTASQKMSAELFAVRTFLGGASGGSSGGGSNGTVSLTSGVWSLPSCSESGQVERGGTLVGDMRDFPSGQYQFELKVDVTTSGVRGVPTGSSTTTSMLVPIINYAQSPFGSGWGIVGLQHIIENRDGSLLLIDDSGTNLRFAPPPSTGLPYLPPPGDFSVMEKLANGTFRRTLKDGTVFQFNSDNKLALERDRNGNTTEYQYTGGRLSAIVDPVGLTTRFVYNQSLLTAIMDPYGRRTEIRHDELGNLTRVIAPDGATTSWTYDSYHHTTSMTDANGNVGSDIFDAMGRGIGVSFADGSTARVQSMQGRGFSQIYIGDHSGSPPPATVERTAVYVDSNGNTIRMVLDGQGQAKLVTDSIGQVSSTLRNSSNLITETVDGRGNLTSYEYDNRGNLTKLTDAISRVDFEPDAIWVGGSGDWHVPSNWSTGVVPGPQDDVLIDRANSNITISITNGPAFANRLIINEDLSLSYSTLTLTGESLLSAKLNLNQFSAIVASGSQAEVTVLDSSNSLGSFQAKSGGILRLPQLRSAFGLDVYADSDGEVHIPEVIGLTGSRFKLENGGVVSAPRLERLNDSRIDVYASSASFNGLLTFSDSILDLRSNGSASIPNVSDVTGSSFYVRGAGTSFSMPPTITTHRVGNTDGDRFFHADSGGLLDLSSLLSLFPSDAGYTNRIIAESGGRVLLPSVTAFIDHSIEVRADGANSHVDLSSLASWTGQIAGGGRRSLLYSRTGGSVNLPALTTMQDVDVTLSGAGTLPTAQITSFREGSLSITDRTVDLSGLPNFHNSTLRLNAGGSVLTPNVTDVTGSSFYVSGIGTSFVLPSVITTYNPGDQGILYFQADNGGVLDMSSLSTLTASAFGYTNYILAYSGGTVLLPNVTTLIEHFAVVGAEGAGSFVDMSSLTTWTGKRTGGRLSQLFSRSGGSVKLPDLSTIRDLNLILLGAGTLPTAQITFFRDGILSITDRAVDLSGLPAFVDSRLDLYAGGSVSIPNMTDVSGSSFIVSGAGTAFVMPAAITTYEHGNQDFQGDRYFQADNGGLLDLSSLSSITSSLAAYTTRIIAETGGTVLLPNLSSFINHSAEVRAVGAASLIDLSSLSTWTGQVPSGVRRSQLVSHSGGSIRLASLTTVQDVDVIVSGGGTLPTAQITSFREGSLSITDRAVDLTGLPNFLESTLDLKTGGSVSIPNITDVTGSSFLVSGQGTRFVMPSAVTTYDHGTKSDIFFQADDGGFLDLNSLISITTNLQVFTTRITAKTGGTVSLPNLAAFNDHLAEVRADDANSRINLNSLASWTSPFSRDHRRSSLHSNSGGNVHLPVLTTIQDVDTTLSDANLALDDLTSFLGSVLTLSAGGSFSTPQLTDVTGSSFNVSGAGTRFVMPSAITTYDHGSQAFQGDRYFQAYSGGLLDLRSLSSITSSLPVYTTRIVAESSGTVLLPNLSSLINHSAEVRADGTGSRIDLSSLASWTGQIAGGGRRSILYGRTGGSVSLGALTTIAHVDSTFAAPSGFTIAQIASWKNSNLAFTGGTFNFTNLADADNSNLTINAARVNAPVLSNIGAGVVTLSNGGVLDAPNLPGFGGGGEGPDGGGGQGNSGSGNSGNGATGGNGNEGEHSPSPQVRPRTFAYDAMFSQLTSQVDELGRITLHTIDPVNGNRLMTRSIVGHNDLESSETDDQLTTFTYTASGQLDLLTDPLGRISDWDYDSLGRVIRLTIAKGTADQAVMLSEYNAFGNMSAEVDANGHLTEYEYDLRDRLTLVRDAAGNVTRYAYDSAGNMIQQTDPRGNIWKYTFDRKHRMTEMRDPQNNVTRYRYDLGGNMVSTVDPLGNTTRYEYDVRGRRIKSIDPDGGVTRFAYDLDNNLIALTDPVGNTTTFDYDARSRQITETDPLGKEIQYQYDAVDNLVRNTDRLQRATQYQYDELDRLVSETWVGDTNRVTYDYDLADNLLHVKDNFSELTYSYDALDRVVSVDNAGTPSAPHVLLAYRYDAGGNVLSVTDTIAGTPNATTGYQYDALNRLATLTQTAAPGAAATATAFLPSDKRVDFSYNPISQYNHIRRYSDLAGTNLVIDTAYAYDNVSRLTSIDHLNSAGSAVSFFHYQYDTSSRIAQITDIDGVTNYSYDQRDQLIGADHTDPNNPDESYTYDANGNRLDSHLHGNGYVTGPANRLLSDGTYNYAYDDEGSLVRRTRISGTEADGSTVREFHWDHRNRLTAVIDKDSSGTATQEVRFTYDAFNRRIAKAVDTTPTDAIDAAILHFVYDREDVILDFADEDGTGAQSVVLAERYLHGPDIDQVLAQDDGRSEWIVADHLGTTRDIVSASGILLNHIRYGGFGEIVAQTDSDKSSRFSFTGREFDTKIDLYYYRARYYDPQPGVFIGEDWIGFAGGANLSRYVSNNPLSLRDPFGLDPKCDSDHQGIVNDAFCVVAATSCDVFGEIDPIKKWTGLPIPDKPKNWPDWLPNPNIPEAIACAANDKHCVAPVECEVPKPKIGRDPFGAQDTDPEYGYYSRQPSRREWRERQRRELEARRTIREHQEWLSKWEEIINGL